MLGAAVGHRPDDRELVGVGREPRQVVADADAGHVRGDRPELAADPLGGVGLEVPEVLAGRAAPEEEEDARPRLAAAAGRGRGGPLHAQQVRERQRPQADLAETDHRIASVDHHGSLRGRQAGSGGGRGRFRRDSGTRTLP